MIELSIPAVLGMVVVGLYNMMDSIFVGQMVGDVQMQPSILRPRRRWDSPPVSNMRSFSTFRVFPLQR